MPGRRAVASRSSEARAHARTARGRGVRGPLVTEPLPGWRAVAGVSVLRGPTTCLDSARSLSSRSSEARAPDRSLGSRSSEDRSAQVAEFSDL